MAEEFNDMMKNFGMEDVAEELNQPMKNKGGFYVHEPGEKAGFVGRFKLVYMNKDGKKCDRSDPGATLKHALLYFVVARDTDGTTLVDKAKIKENEPYGHFVYIQFITLDPSKQWQNARLLSNFSFNNRPELAVVQGEKNNEDIYLKHLPLYYGTPIKFTVEAGKKEDSRFVNQVELIDHEISKEKLNKRKQVMENIEEQLTALLEKNKAESSEQSNPETEVDDPASYMPDDFRS